MIKPFFTNILVAINGSEASISAAKYAIIMARSYRCKLTAVYVVDTASIRQLALSRIFIPEESQEYERNLQGDGDKYLAFVEELALAKGLKIEKEIRQGAVYSEILAAADEKKTDLIILGGWEKDLSSRDTLSNTHKEIMSNAKCSVLLAKEPYIDRIYKMA